MVTYVLMVSGKIFVGKPERWELSYPKIKLWWAVGGK
jgi:hypothetical protein